MRIAKLALPATLPVLLALTACGGSQPPPTQVIIQQSSLELGVRPIHSGPARRDSLGARSVAATGQRLGLAGGSLGLNVIQVTSHLLSSLG